MITIRLGRPPLVDPEFWTLPAGERMAVIAHEAGHVYHKHLWRRLVLAWFMGRDELRAFYHHQELQADAFAASMGYGAQLAAFLARRPDADSLHHPATKRRVAILR